MSSDRQLEQAQIDQIVAETGGFDARDAVRLKASELIALYCAQFGDPTMPIDVHVLASLRGITHSTEAPAHSEDAELVPDGSGGVSMRVNPDRPETRKRFSIGHEVTHTFFPGYELKVQCRPDSRYRNRDDPEDVIESLCDVGAAELVLPLPWFADDAASVTTADGLVALARKYKASREATARRFAETSKKVTAAVFMSWKLKPTQVSDFNPNQSNLFGTTAAEDSRAARNSASTTPSRAAASPRRGFFCPRTSRSRSKGPSDVPPTARLPTASAIWNSARAAGTTAC